MHIAWDDMQLFLCLAETRSMSRAAAQLRVRQPTISRRLASLEATLGYTLFRRSAAGVTLTAGGESLLGPAQKMAEWAGELTRAAERRDVRASGVVRIAAPPGVAWDFLAPFAAWLKTKEPNITLQVLCGIHYVDLARGEADLALRMRAAVHDDLVTVATIRHDNAPFVARSYAKKLPRKPKLAELDWICWAPPFEDVPPNPQLEAWIPNFRPAFSTDNFLVMRRAAEAGIGALVLGKLRHRFTNQQTLVPLAVDLGPSHASELHLVCAKSALDIPRVRAVAGRIADELAQVRPW
jgi:DNA-binding transcriptional LysR family regulator